MLNSVIANGPAVSVVMEEFLVCTAASVALGMALAWIHAYKNRVSQNFMLTLILLPVIVQTVIMLVNGNLGTGVAVMGAFSLVRFRSAPGNSREIANVFLAMAMGLATGMGYLGVVVFLLLIVGCITIAAVTFSEKNGKVSDKELKITIPENLDYQGIFDDLFEKYAKHAELLRVRTVNMGSLYELQYHVVLRGERLEKEFLDQIRCRNGNLELVCGRIPRQKRRRYRKAESRRPRVESSRQKLWIRRGVQKVPQVLCWHHPELQSRERAPVQRGILL